MDRAALSKLVVGEANAERLKQLEVTPRPTRFFWENPVWEATCYRMLTQVPR